MISTIYNLNKSQYKLMRCNFRWAWRR